MFQILLFIHIVLCVTLVGLVLMQQGKGADMGAAFGGSSSTLFGAGGATDFITKLTTGLAVAFMVTSILLVRAYAGFSETAAVTTNNPLEGSVVREEPAQPAAVAPEAVPADTAPSTEIEAQEADEAPQAPAAGNSEAASQNPQPEAAQ